MAEAAVTRSTDTRTLLPRVPCECTTAECKECPERADSAASRYSAYLLYWYKRDVLAYNALVAGLEKSKHWREILGTHFTCFTGTKVLILTQKSLLGVICRGRV